MKLFKSVDEKLSEIGFVKSGENKQFGATYERVNSEHNYVQCLDLLHKASGRHLIQSYQKDVNLDKFNNSVGLSIYEAKLAVKKMKQLRYKLIK